MIYQEAQSGVIQSKYNKLIIKNYQDFLHDRGLTDENVSQRNNQYQNHRSQQFYKKQKTPIRNKNHGYEQFKGPNQVKVIGRSQHNQKSYKPGGLNYHKSISQAERNDIIGLSMKIQSKSKQQRSSAAKKHNRNQFDRALQSKEDSSIFDTNQAKYEIDGNHNFSKKTSVHTFANIETAPVTAASQAIQITGNQLGQNEKLYRSREVLREQQYRQVGRRAIPLKVHDFTNQNSIGVLDTETPSVLQNKVLQQGYLPEKYRLFQGKIIQKSVNEYRNPKLRENFKMDVSKSQGDHRPGDRSTLQLRMSTPALHQDSIDTNDSQEAYGQAESVPNIQGQSGSQLTQKNLDSGQIRDIAINFRAGEPTGIDGQTNTTGGYPVPGSMGTFNQKKNSQNSAVLQQRPYKSSYNNTNTQSTLSQPQGRAKSIEAKKRKKLQNPLFATNYRGEQSVDNMHEHEGLTQNLTQSGISQSSLPKNLNSGYQSGQKILQNNHFNLHKQSGITQVHGSAIEAIAETNVDVIQLLKMSSVDEAVNQQPFSSYAGINNELNIRNEAEHGAYTQKAQHQAPQNFQFSDSQAPSISQNASIERMANANVFDVFENQDSSMNLVNTGFSQRVPDAFDTTRNQMTTNIQLDRKKNYMSQMETRKPHDISQGPGGVIDINQLLSAGHSQQNNGLANLGPGRFQTAMGTVSYDNPVGFYMNHMKNKIDGQHLQSGNYISIQSRNDGKTTVFDKNDINFTTMGTKKTFQQGRLSMTHEMKNLITEATAARTDETRGMRGLKNSKSIDNLDRKKVFIGQLKIGQFKNQKGKLQHQETMVAENQQKLIRNNSTMTTNNAYASNNMPHFGKRTKRSVPTHANGTMSAQKQQNIDIKDLNEMSRDQNSISLNKRLKNQAVYTSFQTGSKETSQTKLPDFNKQQKHSTTADKQIKQLYYGFSYDQHSNIREALHGSTEKPHITAFNTRKTLRQIQLDMQQREQNAMKGGQSQSSGNHHDDYNPLRQDKATAIGNKLNNQNAPLENGSILHNQMTLSNTSLPVDKLTDMTNAENLQVIRDTIKARGGPDEVHFGVIDQAGIVFENAKDMNANLFTGAINKISQVYGMNADSTLIESYQPVKMEIPKINAKFYRIPVQGKKAPAVIEVYHPASQGGDFRLFWSQTQRYPCETPTECEGAFTYGEKTMYLNPSAESSFSKEFIYIGFYSKNGFNASFAVGFGRNCENNLRHILVAAADNKEYTHQKKTKINIDDITSEMSDRGFAEIEEQQHISRQDQLKLWKLKTKQRVKKLMNNDIERGVYFNKCNEIKEQQNAKAMALRQVVQQKEQESQIKMKTSQILNSLFGKPRSPVSAEMGTDSASKFGGDGYQQLMQSKFQQQFEKQQQSYVSEQDYFLKRQTVKNYTDKEREGQQLEQYKYSVFLTIKNQVLKQVKDQSVDEKIAVLRKHKLARTHVILIKISKRIKQLWLKILKRRREICLKNLRFLKSFKLQMAYRRYVRQHAPDIVKGSEYSSSYESDSSEEQPDIWMPKRKLAGLKKQKTDMQKLHYAKYLKPAIRLLYVTMNKQADDFLTEKRKIYGFLHEMAQKNQIKIFFRITIETISTFQKLIRSYFSKKRLWEVMIRRGMEDEIPKLRDFIRQMKAGRDQYEWMIEELEDLAAESGRVYIDKVCKSMVQYLKDVHVLNVYRFQCQVLAKPVKADTLEGSAKFIKKSKKEFFGAYTDDMDKFPSRLLVDGNVKTKDDVDVKSKKKGKKGGADDGRQAISLANIAQVFKDKQNLDSMSTDDDDRIVSLQEIESVYAETGARFIPFVVGRTGSLLFDVPHPQMNVLDNIAYFKKIPGNLMLKNSQIIQHNKKIKDKIYEVTQFRELIFYGLIEQKRGRYEALMNRSREEE